MQKKDAKTTATVSATAKDVAKSVAKTVDAKAKETVKDAVKAVETKAKDTTESVKAATKKATTAKKPAAKKTTTKKTAKVEQKTQIIVQYNSSEVEIADIEEKIKAQFISEGHRAGSIKKLSIYIKPEDYAAYYVINEKFSGRVDLF